MEQTKPRKGVVGLIVLGLALGLALFASMMLIVGHVKPEVDTILLLRLAYGLVFGAFGLFFGSLTLPLSRRWPRPFGTNVDLISVRFFWYIWVRRAIYLLAVIELLTSGFASISWDNGHWYASNRGARHFEIPADVAIDGLWRDVRTGASCILVISVSWTPFALTLLRKSRV